MRQVDEEPERDVLPLTKESSLLAEEKLNEVLAWIPDDENAAEVDEQELVHAFLIVQRRHFYEPHLFIFELSEQATHVAGIVERDEQVEAALHKWLRITATLLLRQFVLLLHMRAEQHS